MLTIFLHLCRKSRIFFCVNQTSLKEQFLIVFQMLFLLSWKYIRANPGMEIDPNFVPLSPLDYLRQLHTNFACERIISDIFPDLYLLALPSSEVFPDCRFYFYHFHKTKGPGKGSSLRTKLIRLVSTQALDVVVLGVG